MRRRRAGIVVVLGAVIVAGCGGSRGTSNARRPSIAALTAQRQVPFGTLQTQEVALLAPKSFLDSDPDMCPTAAHPDPQEMSIGGLSSRAVYKFDDTPHIQDLYGRLVVETKICTDATLSSQDRKALEKVLNFLGITNAQSFAATVSLTGDGNGGVKYPQFVPFSYAFDQSKSTYTVQTIGNGVIPWQVTNAFEVQYAYNANKNTAINTAGLFSTIVTDMAGAGTAASLLSPAANAYLAAGNAVLQHLAQSVFSQINNGSDSFHMDLLQGPVRTVTYRFRDLSNRPLAAVRIGVAFTNSIARPSPVDPATDDSMHMPQFSELQFILNAPMGGPGSGQTLLQQISKEPSFQSLLKANEQTTPTDFRGACDNLEASLQTIYGLNRYDTALTMGQVLSQENTLYLNHQNFYNSGCFRTRSVLSSMGIHDFEHAPGS